MLTRKRELLLLVMKTERDREGNEAADWEEKMLMKMKIVTRAAARDTVKGSKEGKKRKKRKGRKR